MFHSTNSRPARRSRIGRLVAVLGVLGAATLGTNGTAAAQDALPPMPVGYMSPQGLELYCALRGGSYESGGPGRSYLCVLPNGVVIFCNYQRGVCVVLKQVPQPSTRVTPTSRPVLSSRSA